MPFLGTVEPDLAKVIVPFLASLVFTCNSLARFVEITECEAPESISPLTLRPLSVRGAYKRFSFCCVTVSVKS